MFYHLVAGDIEHELDDVGADVVDVTGDGTYQDFSFLLRGTFFLEERLHDV